MLKHPHNVTSKRFKFLDIRSEDTLRYHYCFLILIWCTNDSISPSHFCHKLPYLIVRSWSPKVSSGDLCCLLVVIAPFLITPWAVYLCTSETTLTLYRMKVCQLPPFGLLTILFWLTVLRFPISQIKVFQPFFQNLGAKIDNITLFAVVLGYNVKLPSTAQNVTRNSVLDILQQWVAEDFVVIERSNGFRCCMQKVDRWKRTNKQTKQIKSSPYPSYTKPSQHEDATLLCVLFACSVLEPSAMDVTDSFVSPW